MKGYLASKAEGLETEGTYSDLKVMKSNAGWYIGTTFIYKEDGREEPGSRESEYFPNKEMAQDALNMNKWKQREYP